MKTYTCVLYFFVVLATMSCKKKEVVDPYGDPKYFVKVQVIEQYAGLRDRYGFYLMDGGTVLLRTDALTNNDYENKYKMRELYPVSLRVIDWDNKFLYWDSDLVIDEQKENFEIPLIMNSDKKLRILMSEDVLEKHYLDIEIPVNSGISVLVKDQTSEARYIDVLTNSRKIHFLKGWNVYISATNQGGYDIEHWRINSGGVNEFPVKKQIEINDISKDYTILVSPDPF